MNINLESYPENVNVIFSKAFNMASTALADLNHQECPRLEDLFIELHKTCGVQPEYSISRNKRAFEELGYIPNIISGKSKSLNEFKGLYIFGEEINGSIIPVYVGISRTVYRRLRQHGWGKKHNECSLAYLKARNEDDTLSRSTVNDDLHLKPKKEIIQSFKVVLIPVKEDYDLYFLEVTIAGILKTKWNSFRTH